MMQQKSAKVAWIDFLICFFFGIYGVHKFREKKIGLGILYLFTGGLFAFGWLIDCGKYFVTAIKTSFSSTKITDSINTEGATSIKQFFAAHWKKIALGIGAFYLLIFIIAIASSPNIDSSNNDNTLNGINATLSSTEDSLFTNSSIDTTTESTVISTTETTTETTAESTTETTTQTEPPHVHKYSAATCTEPKTCSCGATEGSANGHSWTEATCTSPKICTICSERSGSATNHKYANGKCTTCGSKDPNYVSEEMVWIPTRGGEKYHRKSSCSKMIDPIQVTKSDAISQGFGPCGRCY